MHADAWADSATEPAGQSEHAPAPVAALKVPALQFRQVVAPVPAWKVPVAHEVQRSAFATTEKVPATQSWHAVSGAQKVAVLCWPGLHTTAAQEVDPTPAVNVHAAQAVHWDAPPAE